MKKMSFLTFIILFTLFAGISCAQTTHTLNLRVMNHYGKSGVEGVYAKVSNETWASSSETTGSSGWAYISGLSDGDYNVTVRYQNPTNGAIMKRSGFTVSGSDANLILNNDFYYSSWDDYYDRNLMVTSVQGGAQWASGNNITGYFNEFFYTKPYFQSVILIYDGPWHMYTQRDFIKELAERADAEDYDIVMACGCYYTNGYVQRESVDNVTLQEKLDETLDYIGNHSSIKMLHIWTEYCNFPDTRDEMLEAANNWTEIAEAHDMRAGWLRTASGGEPSDWTKQDYGMYYFFWHCNFPKEHKGTLTWWPEAKPGLLGTGGGLWDPSYRWSEYNVSEVFDQVFSTPYNDYHYITWGSTWATLQLNYTVREWIHQYSRSSNYESQLKRNQHIMNSTDSQERLWLASNATVLSSADGPNWMNITVDGSGGEGAAVYAFVPYSFMQETGDNVSKILVDGVETSPSEIETWSNGDILYKTYVTFSSPVEVAFLLGDDTTVSTSTTTTTLEGDTTTTTTGDSGTSGPPSGPGAPPPSGDETTTTLPGETTSTTSPSGVTTSTIGTTTTTALIPLPEIPEVPEEGLPFIYIIAAAIGGIIIVILITIIMKRIPQ